MSNLKKYLNRETKESIARFLSSIYNFSIYDIKKVIEQVDSIDDTIVILYECQLHNLSLDEGVYLKLRGKDK